jgi:integrase
MARKATGTITEHVGKDGTVYRSLRFTAYGKRRHVPLGAVSLLDAQRHLRGVLADVERGVWKAPQPPPPEPEGIATFHEFSEQWWVRYSLQLRESTRADYTWRLERHLLPFFGEMLLNRITYDTVERYIAAKLSESDPLAPRSINMTIVLLGQILESALERDLIARNPARGKRRRVIEHTPETTYLDTAEQITSLLDAAGRLDAQAHTGRRHIHRRAMIATLVFAGLRIGELTGLRWRDVDLASGRLKVGEAKTDAGVRRIKIRGALRDELLAIRPADVDPDAFVFATSTGERPSRENIRTRVLGPAVKAANEQRVAAGHTPLPEGLTPHSLRRTFASVSCHLGENPRILMNEMGHTNAAFAVETYTKEMSREPGEMDALRALVDGGVAAGGGAPRGPATHPPPGRG